MTADPNLSEMIENYEALAAQAAHLGVKDRSIDAQTVILLRELEAKRIEVSELKMKLRDWENWLAGACV